MRLSSEAAALGPPNGRPTDGSSATQGSAQNDQPSLNHSRQIDRIVLFILTELENQEGTLEPSIDKVRVKLFYHELDDLGKQWFEEQYGNKPWAIPHKGHVDMSTSPPRLDFYQVLGSYASFRRSSPLAAFCSASSSSESHVLSSSGEQRPNPQQQPPTPQEQLSSYQEQHQQLAHQVDGARPIALASPHPQEPISPGHVQACLSAAAEAILQLHRSGKLHDAPIAFENIIHTLDDSPLLHDRDRRDTVALVWIVFQRLIDSPSHPWATSQTLPVDYPAACKHVREILFGHHQRYEHRSTVSTASTGISTGAPPDMSEVDEVAPIEVARRAHSRSGTSLTSDLSQAFAGRQATWTPGQDDSLWAPTNEQRSPAQAESLGHFDFGSSDFDSIGWSQADLPDMEQDEDSASPAWHAQREGSATVDSRMSSPTPLSHAADVSIDDSQRPASEGGEKGEETLPKIRCHHIVAVAGSRQLYSKSYSTKGRLNYRRKMQARRQTKCLLCAKFCGWPPKADNEVWTEVTTPPPGLAARTAARGPSKLYYRLDCLQPPCSDRGRRG